MAVKCDCRFVGMSVAYSHSSKDQDVSAFFKILKVGVAIYKLSLDSKLVGLAPRRAFEV